MSNLDLIDILQSTVNLEKKYLEKNWIFIMIGAYNIYLIQIFVPTFYDNKLIVKIR